MLDRELFESLFRTHYQELCLFANRFVKDYEVSREIVQDCYIRLWEKRESIDPSKPVKSYLSTSVRNTCLNWLRDHRKFNANLLDIEGLVQDSGTYQADRLVEGEIREGIQNAIQELPERCREVFVLNRYENLKYQEIADRLHISLKTVETQMSKALSHMRVRLKEYLMIVAILVIRSLGH
jgi:RNA polymerase sigma-70 factor (ECF subfamily)